MFEPEVSIIIPAVNEERLIGNLLNSIKDCDYPKDKLEIIVVGDCSTDNTDDIVRTLIDIFPELDMRLIKDKHEGVGTARNLGWRSAKHDLIAMIDADHEVTNNYLHEIVKPLKDPNIHGVNPITFIKNKKNILSKLYWHRDRLGEETFPANFRIFRREVLEATKGYDNKLSVYDDQDLCDRAKGLGFNPVKNNKAILYHTYTGTIKDMWNDNRWRGGALVKLLKHSPKKALRIGIFPLICISGLIFRPLLILFTLMEIKRMYGMWKNEKWIGLLLVPFFDIIDMFLYTIGILKGIFNLNKKVVK